MISPLKNDRPLTSLLGGIEVADGFISNKRIAASRLAYAANRIILARRARAMENTKSGTPEGIYMENVSSC